MASIVNPLTFCSYSVEMIAEEDGTPNQIMSKKPGDILRSQSVNEAIPIPCGKTTIVKLVCDQQEIKAMILYARGVIEPTVNLITKDPDGVLVEQTIIPVHK